MESRTIQKNDYKNRRGFTLIEILLVIGLIAMLAAIVIIAINPARQFAQARDATRWSDINTILNGVHQYSVDNNGTLPTSVTSASEEICRTGTLAATCTASSLVDLSAITTGELYLISMPIDPTCVGGGGDCDPDGTGYYISVTPGGRLEVDAGEAELVSPIAVTR